MSNFTIQLATIKEKMLRHKRLTALGVVVIFAVIYYFYHSVTTKPAATQYVLSKVERGTITVTVGGTGQVSSSNQVDVKPQVSGKVLRLAVSQGQTVAAGAILAQLDATDALKSVRDAEISLESAELSLAKLTRPAGNLTTIQAENALAQAQENKKNAQDDLVKAYDDGFNVVSNVWLDLPTVITGAHDVLFSNSIANVQWNIDYYDQAISQYESVKSYLAKSNAKDNYDSARVLYDKNYEVYKNTNRFSDTSTIESIINSTYNTAKSLAEAIKSSNNFIQLYIDTMSAHSLRPNAAADTALTSLNSYTAKMNSALVSLLSAKNTIQNDKDSIVSSDRSIAEKVESLKELKAGPDALDLKSQELSIRQKQIALSDARQKLVDYTVRAPIDGVVAEVGVKLNDEASASSIIATLMAKEQVAEISLNEVDVSKIKVGQKATLTFDAIEDLTITGVVSQIDSIGTVSQGVVSYSVKITFDTHDDRVKSGMTVSAAVITDIKSDVLIVVNSAIKSQGNSQYVEMLDSTFSPRQQVITAGLANDTESEIISGLEEGDSIITRTISGATKSTTQTSASNILSGAGGGPAGGVMRRLD